MTALGTPKQVSTRAGRRMDRGMLYFVSRVLTNFSRAFMVPSPPVALPPLPSFNDADDDATSEDEDEIVVCVAPKLDAMEDNCLGYVPVVASDMISL